VRRVSTTGILDRLANRATSLEWHGDRRSRIVTIASSGAWSAASTFVGSMFFVAGSTSTKTGFAPKIEDRLARAYEGIRGGDDLVTRADSRGDEGKMERRRAGGERDSTGRGASGGGVSDVVATAASSSLASSVVSHPERSTSETASISLFVMDGLWKGMEFGTARTVAHALRGFFAVTADRSRSRLSAAISVRMG